MADIYKLLNEVMKDVGAVRKAERNTHQNFSFRGIDSVVNAVSPAFRKHGVVAFPQMISNDYETVTIGERRTQMGYARLVVKYVFAAPDGSSVEVVVPAEAMDSGDKATAKAMSVAYRTALLQTLCLPTDESDPDADTYERSSETAPPAPPVERTVKRGTQRTTKTPTGSAATRRSDAQAKLIGDLLVQIGGDDQLVTDYAGKPVDDMTMPEAKKIIDALLAVKRKDKEVVLDDNGCFTIR